MYTHIYIFIYVYIPGWAPRRGGPRPRGRADHRADAGHGLRYHNMCTYTHVYIYIYICISIHVYIYIYISI